MITEERTAVLLLDRALRLDPQVALRPEPFGALAYHYGNRRLVFLKDPDMVAVARQLGEHDSLAHALRACGVDEQRWPSFAAAFQSLIESHVIAERDGPGDHATHDPANGVQGVTE